MQGQGFKIDIPMFIKLARKVGVTSWCVYSWLGNLTSVVHVILRGPILRTEPIEEITSVSMLALRLI